MTNETVMAYTFVGFPNVFANPKNVAPGTVGYAYKGLFGNIGSKVNQIPSFGNFGPSEAALVFNPGGFEAGGTSQGLYANKWMPSVSDTFTKVVKSHTLKAGFFYEWIRNAQPANNNSNGQALVSVGNTYSYGNEYADLLTGNLNSYNETNFNRLNDISYNTFEFFAQDSWKATRRLIPSLTLRSIVPQTAALARLLPRSAASHGTPRTVQFPSEASPHGPSSISRASAPLTT
jgi:hypothetical protein